MELITFKRKRTTFLRFSTMERWEVKLIAMGIVFCVITFCTLLPIKVAGAFHRRGKRGERVLGMLACFGGGVFFGAYLLHMAPEVRETLESALMEPNDIDYPLPEFFMGLGFFLLMFIEKFVHISTRKKTGKDTARDRSTTREALPEITMDVELNDVKEVTVSQEKIQNGHLNEGYMAGDAEGQKKVKVTENGQHPQEHYHDAEAGHSHQVSGENALQSLILLMALSLDCVFEGMSLGLQEDEQGVWNLVVAILSHEIVIAFTLGLQLVKFNSTKKVVGLGLFYGITVPIGIGIGMAIYESSSTSGDTLDIVAGVLQGIAAGVFIYCTFFEILVHEISYDAPLYFIVAVFVGFGLMCGLAAIPHEHDHSHSPVAPNDTASDHGHHHHNWVM